mmetsp:Transcript_10585/g.21350  ORF Transcript_10585/g.21350 Transcript_10585/m.21350 type:complete len:172 (+) Transcript_10585:655-1170(+)
MPMQMQRQKCLVSKGMSITNCSSQTIRAGLLTIIFLFDASRVSCAVGAFSFDRHSGTPGSFVRPDRMMISTFQQKAPRYRYYMYAKRSATVAHVKEEDGDDENDDPGSDTTSSDYKPPQHSSNFLQHLEQVRGAWPDKQEDDEEGVECTGEPAVDPSRIVQAAPDDDSNWM